MLTTSDGCTASNQATVTLNPLNGKEICVVTTDITLLKNKVEWMPTVGHGKTLVNIYRENVTGTYDSIGTATDSIQYFIDTVSNPVLHSYQYEISLTDTCGIESTHSPYHETMHLSLLSAVGGN